MFRCVSRHILLLLFLSCYVSCFLLSLRPDDNLKDGNIYCQKSFTVRYYFSNSILVK